MITARVFLRGGSVVALSLLLPGCSGSQSALNPAGEGATQIANLWWLFFAVCAAVYVLVMAAVIVAALRTRSDPDRLSERRLGIAVGSATAVTIAILFILLLSSIFTGRALGDLDAEPHLRIVVTAQQWWWKLDYHHPDPSKRITTANEMVIPVGTPVQLELRSRDVIHSLWIPSIHGKRDLIPGRTTTFVIRADRAGRFDGQCAEFCGIQHAKMRLQLVALPPSDYEAWAANQLLDAAPPHTSAEARGRDVFLSGSCPLCHTVRGTPARGTNGPDLTHLASRRMIAANSAPNLPGHLAGWVVDPQSIKPGNHMPPNPLPGEDLQPLVAWLRSLK